MKRLVLAVFAILAITSCARMQGAALGDEGIEDDPNHPESIEAAREVIRAEKDLAAATENLKDLYMLQNCEDPHKNPESYNRDKRRIETMLGSLDKAWDEYLNEEARLETDLLAGPGAGGHPRQLTGRLIRMRLIRERIDHIKNILEIAENDSAEVDSRIRTQVHEIERKQTAWRKRMLLWR